MTPAEWLERCAYDRELEVWREDTAEFPHTGTDGHARMPHKALEWPYTVRKPQSGTQSHSNMKNGSQGEFRPMTD